MSSLENSYTQLQNHYISALTKPNMVPIKKFYDELLNNSDKDPMAQFVSMYIKGVLSSPEKSVVDIINSKTNSNRC